MAKLPEALLQSLEGVAGFHRDSFIAVHEEGKAPTSIRLNASKVGSGKVFPTDGAPVSPLTTHHSPIPWCGTGRYLAQRPSFTFDPLFHAGCYYVQEASSMFLEQAFKQLLNLSLPLKVLDLCAAPGGKSTHIQSLISTDSLLVSNEVIRQRSLVLTDNITRWGASNVLVSNNDPRAFGVLPGFFDVLIVDAPCSGSGLFRKDAGAIEEWSLNNVALCSGRQQRILVDALPSLKQGGLLVYSTCSYSEEEDEQIMDWLVQEMGMDNLRLNVTDFDGIVTTTTGNAEGYRFYPDRLRGEGFFLACFRKTEDEPPKKFKPAKREAVQAAEQAAVQQWLKMDGHTLLRFRDGIIALPKLLVEDFYNLQTVLNLTYAGIAAGQVLKGKLVPHHALALNILLSDEVVGWELDYDTAIRYLQRQELLERPENVGWQVVRYQNHALGWVNVLSNRTNNYYPKELRILKAFNDGGFKK